MQINFAYPSAKHFIAKVFYSLNLAQIIGVVLKILQVVMGYTGVKKKDVEIDRGLNFYS